MNRHQFNVLISAVPVCAAALLQVGCSAQEADTPVTTSSVVSPSTSTSTTPGDAPAVTTAPPMSQAFTDCMSQHGVAQPAGPPTGPPDSVDQPPLQTPEQGSPPPGVDQQTWEEALRACESLAPEPPGA